MKLTKWRREQNAKDIAEARLAVAGISDSGIEELSSLVANPERLASVLRWMSMEANRLADEERIKNDGDNCDGMSSLEWHFYFRVQSALLYAYSQIDKALNERGMTEVQIRLRDLRVSLAQSSEELRLLERLRPAREAAGASQDVPEEKA